MYLLVSLFLAMGLMSKSMAVTLPCVFILLDIWPLGRWKRALWPPGRKNQEPEFFAVLWLLLEKIPWFGLVYIDCSITYYGQNKGVALNSWEGLPLVPRLLNAVVSCGEYLRQMVWPTGLAPFYTHPSMLPDGWIAKLLAEHKAVPFFPNLATIPDDWTRDFYVKFYLYLGLLAVITGVAIFGFFCKRPFLPVGWFWYLGTLIPVIGIIQVGTQARADRYTYLPMIGVYLMVAWMLMEVVQPLAQDAAFPWRPLRSSSLLALSAVTFRQVSYWVDSYKLFNHAVAGDGKELLRLQPHRHPIRQRCEEDDVEHRRARGQGVVRQRSLGISTRRPNTSTTRSSRSWRPPSRRGISRRPP